MSRDDEIRRRHTLEAAREALSLVWQDPGRVWMVPSTSQPLPSGRAVFSSCHGVPVTILNIRLYIDPETGEPHILSHGVEEGEVEDILTSPGEDRPGREGARIAIGRTRGGRWLRVIYVPGQDPEQVFVIMAYELSGKPLAALPAAHEKEEPMKNPTRFPAGWDEERVQRVLGHYEPLSEDEAVAEDGAFEESSQMVMAVPREQRSSARAMIAEHTPIAAGVPHPDQ